MKKYLCLALALAMLLGAFAGCSGAAGGGDSSELPPTADGSERHEYTMLDSDDVYWFNYLKTWGTDGPCIIIDGLINYDMYGVVSPGMATEWSVSDDGLVYTYKLREDAKWWDYECKEYGPVTAHDFVAGLKYTLTPANECSTVNLVYDYIVNAEAYYNGEITDFNEVGVKALDDYTVEYTLVEPTPYFLKLSGYNCYFPVSQKFLDEVGDQFGLECDKLLYNGAYYCSVKLPEDRAEFVINPHYWDVEHIYISKLNYRYSKDNSLSGEMFQRGELDKGTIPAELKKEWVEDETGMGLWAQRAPYDANSWFYGFNFEPTYEGNGVEDYKIAVNNVNFRKSVFHAIDRVAASYTMELWKPEEKVLRTITPPTVMYVDGVDYTQIGPLAEISNTDAYDTDKAVEYKATALEELTGKVAFPVTLVIPYNTSDLTETNIAQLVKQQLESLLGADYVNVALEAFAPTNYNTMTRSAGAFSLMLMRWGADYADPGSYTDIFNPELSVGAKYSRPFLAEEYIGADGVSEYVKLMQAGLDERLDMNKRYELLAEAEAFLINNAMVMPLFRGSGGWFLTKLDPFIGANGQFGRDVDIMKGKKVLEEPLTRAEYDEAAAQYELDKAAALAAAAGN